MKNAKISRRSFLLGLAACSAAGVLTACSGSSEPASSASTAPEPPASSAASEVTAAPFLTVEDFPALDGSTACIPLMAQMLADTTGMDLEEAQSIISVSTTAYAWESFGLYNTDTKMLVVYEAPDSVKEELETANVQLEQKPIGVDALVFIVNEDNPVTDLTQQQLRDIYAGKITNWKDVGGKDQAIVAFQRGEDSGSQTLFKKLLIQGGELMTPPSELAPAAMGELVDSIADYNNSANAIGFSVYYYIDQMYSKPGLRLLAVDGVTPSNDTLADGSYPLCNDFYAVIHPDAGKYKESIPWRVYAAEQEALKRLDDQNVKLDAMRHEAEQMENELEAKRKELEETSEATSVVEEMKNTIMPDGRSMWEHNLARIRAERERKMREEEESKRKRKNASTTRRLPRYLSEDARAQIDEQEERIARQVRENANAGRSERLQRKTLDVELSIESNSSEEAGIDLQSIHR